MTAQGDDAVFPGTIWVANYDSPGRIWVFEPTDEKTAPPMDELMLGESGAPAESGVFVVRQPVIIDGLSVITNAPVLVNTPLWVEAQVSSGDGILYAWDFGDGNTSVGEAATTHTYAALGDYTVSVQAINRVSSVSAAFTITVTDVPPGAADALLTIQGSSNPEVSSTYETGAFRLVNLSTGGQQITKLHIDLRTALIGDLIFVPSGKGGDALGKAFTPDVDDGVGVFAMRYTSPHAFGYDELTVEFDNFTPGKALAFSADIDPAGVLGLLLDDTYHVSSMSGMELTGVTFTLTFDDGTVLTAQPMPLPGSFTASQAAFQSDAPAPGLELLGIDSTPTTVTESAQTVRISAPPDSRVVLLVAEAGLDLKDVPNGGYQIDPYEVNKVIDFTMQYITVGADGFVDVPVMLTRTEDIGGYNLITAAVKGATGSCGALADKLVVYLEAS